MMKKELNRSVCDSTFAHHYHMAHAGMGAARSAILKLLRSIDLVGWSSHEDSGRLDKKSFARFKSGNTNVFKRRDVDEAVTSCVSVLIDCSGSMAFDGSVRIQVAGEIAVQLAKIFSRAKISFAVTGFSGYGGDVRVRASGANALNENLTIENINWIPFKTWGESMQRAAAKLGSIAQWTGYSTPDYSALSVAIEDIAKRPESRKILFVLTDADAYTAEHIRHIDKMAVSQGITLVAVGIQSREVTEIFQNAANVENVSELASTSFTKLLHTLKG